MHERQHNSTVGGNIKNETFWLMVHTVFFLLLFCHVLPAGHVVTQHPSKLDRAASTKAWGEG